MVAGAALADFRVASGSNGQKQDSQNDTTRGAPTALVIGLGGGALPMALRRMYPRVRVATVELDPEMAGIAKEHFGLKESSDGLKVWCVLCVVSRRIQGLVCHGSRLVCLTKCMFHRNSPFASSGERLVLKRTNEIARAHGDGAIDFVLFVRLFFFDGRKMFAST